MLPEYDMHDMAMADLADRYRKSLHELYNCVDFIKGVQSWDPPSLADLANDVIYNAEVALGRRKP